MPIRRFNDKFQARGPKYSGRLSHNWSRRWLPRTNPQKPSRGKIPWSRPISAGVAGNWEEPPIPQQIPGHNLLVVGGEYTFIPDWLLAASFNIKHFHSSGKNFYDALGGFKPDAILLFVKATTGHTKHQVLDYGKQHNIPVLIMSQGWGELMIDAKRKGAAWLAEAYPRAIWVPKEYHDRQAKKRAKKIKRKTEPSPQLRKYKKKRQQAFEQQGIHAEHQRFALTRYLDQHPDQCSLCNKSIKYRYSIDFILPGERDIVSFFPVGSICIREWLNDLPPSPHKQLLMQQAENTIQRAEQSPEKWEQQQLFDF